MNSAAARHNDLFYCIPLLLRHNYYQSVQCHLCHPTSLVAGIQHTGIEQSLCHYTIIIIKVKVERTYMARLDVSEALQESKHHSEGGGPEEPLHIIMHGSQV